MRTIKSTWRGILVPFACSLSLMAHAMDNDFLAQYSYPIFILSNNQQHTGTAFFYRSGDTTFLVSNYHAIKGMSPLKQEIAFSSDTLFLKYPIRNSQDTRIMSIDISAEQTGETEIFSMVNRIDLLKIPVVVPDDADFFYINDLIDTDYLNAVPEDVLVFGFPTTPGSVPTFYSKQQRLEGEVNVDGFTEYRQSLQANFPDASDSARAILGETSRYYYFIKPYAAQGYSGAPVFGTFRTPDNRVIHRFIGVVFAGQPGTRQTWAIKGDVALQYLKGQL